MSKATPVILGAGQFTYRGDPLSAPGPLALMKTASDAAARSAGLSASDLEGLDHVAVVGFAVDAPGALSRLEAPRLENPPESLARALGARPKVELYSHMGGNAPQHLINHLCAKVADGEADFALVVGAEFLGSLMKRLRSSTPFPEGYGEASRRSPERVGDPRPGVGRQEAAHGLGFPVNCYPLFENALRARDGRSLEAHQARLGRLFAPFTEVAAGNPYAWFPKARSAEELVTVSPNNRMISYPYPKLLNAIMEVDQSAAVLISSLERARRLGVPEDRLVFLEGCADANELWAPLERQNFHSSPAVRLSGRKAFDMAGRSLEEVDFIDLYSCFPVAVEVAAEELGLGLDDPRGLTVTGGLPYAGGPGNNYAMHSVAAMRERLLAKTRRDGGSALGLVTANGWFLTKQSVGLYSTRRPGRPFEREDPGRLQAEIDALPHPEIVISPSGPARIETYTVCHAREGYRMGIVVGRDAEGRRFVANVPEEEAVLKDLESREGVGRPGRAVPGADGGLNRFIPD